MPERCVKVIEAAAVLHNMAIIRNLPASDYDLQDEAEIDNPTVSDITQETDGTREVKTDRRKFFTPQFFLHVRVASMLFRFFVINLQVYCLSNYLQN